MSPYTHPDFVEAMKRYECADKGHLIVQAFAIIATFAAAVGFSKWMVELFVGMPMSTALAAVTAAAMWGLSKWTFERMIAAGVHANATYREVSA